MRGKERLHPRHLSRFDELSSTRDRNREWKQRQTHFSVRPFALLLSLSLSVSLSLSTCFAREQHTTENLAKETTAIDDAWAKLCCCWCLRLFDLRFAEADPRQVVSWQPWPSRYPSREWRRRPPPPALPLTPVPPPLPALDPGRRLPLPLEPTPQEAEALLQSSGTCLLACVCACGLFFFSSPSTLIFPSSAASWNVVRGVTRTVLVQRSRRWFQTVTRRAKGCWKRLYVHTRKSPVLSRKRKLRFACCEEEAAAVFLVREEERTGCCCCCWHRFSFLVGEENFEVG